MWSGWWFLIYIAFKVCPVKFSSLCSKHIKLMKPPPPKNASLFWRLLTFPSLLISPHERMTLHMCGFVSGDCILCSLCERTYSVLPLHSKKNERGSIGVNLALLSFPQPLYMCNYIPPLIENRALPQSSRNKELLFPLCVYLHVCVATTASYPWVFPLILSSRLIPYGKLITDWLGSCPCNKSRTSLRFCFEILMETGLRTITMLFSVCISWAQSRLWDSEWALELFLWVMTVCSAHE